MPWPLRIITYATILVVIILFYFGFRYFRCAARLKLQPRWLVRSLYFIPAALFLAYPAAGHFQFWFKGSFSRAEFPDPVIYLFWYGVVCMGVMLNWLILHDLLRALFVYFSKNNPHKLKNRFAKIFLITVALTVPYTAAKMIWDTHRITLEEITYTTPVGKSLSATLTIVHIADLHADPFTGNEKMRRYIDKVNEQNPDIVIFAGDLITSGRDHIEAGAEALSWIESTYGVWFVMGDHDYWSGTDVIAEALIEREVNVLQNQNAWIEHGETLIKITGVTELYSSRINAGLLDQLLLEDRGETLRILASHQASDRLIAEGRRTGVHQLLAGHTHGGQIRIPLFFYPVTAARAETPYVNGNWQMGEMLLNVNNGLGFTLAPVRYNAPAQISVITVTEASN